MSVIQSVSLVCLASRIRTGRSFSTIPTDDRRLSLGIIHGRADILILTLSLKIRLDNLTSTEVIIHGQADILTLSLVEANKESRQKRLVLKQEVFFKLQYFIDTAANTAMLHSLGGINLDSLNSRSHPTYVRFRFDRHFRCPI